MLSQNDPFFGFDRFFEQFGVGGRSFMAMDAYRRGNDVWVHVDLPGVAPDSIDVSVERSVLTIAANRDWRLEDGDRVYLNERRQGTFRRQIHLGEGLDAEHIEADYHDGVLTLRIPVAAAAQPRKIAVTTGPAAIDVSSTESTSS